MDRIIILVDSFGFVAVFGACLVTLSSFLVADCDVQGNAQDKAANALGANGREGLRQKPPRT